MTTLYRSPDVVIDAHQWHVVVRKIHGRVVTTYRWRTLSGGCWHLISNWVGPRPKGLCNRMWRYRCHIREALESEEKRKFAAAAQRGVKTGAMLRNAA